MVEKRISNHPRLPVLFPSRGTEEAQIATRPPKLYACETIQKIQ
jgi:hypothetical protein